MKQLGKTEKYDHMKLIREYAGGHKNLITLGRCLAAVSAVMTLIPYYELWKIIRTAVNGENFPETEGCEGWQQFGYNREQQTRQCIIIPICCLLSALVFAYLI